MSFFAFSSAADSASCCVAKEPLGYLVRQVVSPEREFNIDISTLPRSIIFAHEQRDRAPLVVVRGRRIANITIHTYSNGGISRILVYLQYRLSGTFCVLVVSLNIVDTGISVLR